MNDDYASDEDLLSVLRLIAERAGKIVLGYYAEGEDIEVTTKADDSPVTAADVACEEFILDALAKLTPDVPVVSEESFSNGVHPKIGPHDLFWLVDPLDGTKEFLSRNGEFTVNIALVQDGKPIAGVVHAPALAMTWAGSEAKATFSQTDQPPMPIEIRQVPEEGLTVVASRRHGDDRIEDYLAGFQVHQTLAAGSSVKFCLIASGRADLYPRFGPTMEWDTAAGQAVLEAAGGRVETLDGQPLRYGKPGWRNPEFVAFGSK
ncbi:3'(2'),5'-bisphosphate nucleotidase CysQ [Tistlia consotensis]|uniref:3'(2'),5'-bisphosphate nucleotidase CysQ n=1 Tax=Tistlia consotensis TaxID=1321365 RepID=UPI001F3135C9|nr:3'(2'),5'-bisphosphate nucleotidase CysQ [Tistlia consotensis]